MFTQSHKILSQVLLINPRMNLDCMSDIRIPLKKPSYENLRSFLKPSKFVHSNKNFVLHRIAAIEQKLTFLALTTIYHIQEVSEVQF